MKRFLVTGGAGFIGSHLTARPLGAGNDHGRATGVGADLQAKPQRLQAGERSGDSQEGQIVNGHDQGAAVI